MTTTTTVAKQINLVQLQDELVAAGVDVGDGIGQTGDVIHLYDADGLPSNFPAADQATVDQVIADHVAMRDKTDQELAAEFQATSDPARKQDIRDMQSGLMPREQVPMT